MYNFFECEYQDFEKSNIRHFHQETPPIQDDVLVIYQLKKMPNHYPLE
jgi:hypothetical protein